MTVSFYLKYRPQKFLDLDSSEAREELLKIFKSEKIPHALLFSGPRGIGKTSAARIVAKAVNCEKVQSTEYKEHREFEPCNQCDSCISITNGTNVDILEIDAASNRGIDDIKELREKIKLSPASAKYKVYIIDEAHMLTPEAFNALLKTLEEPPKHAIFILCTTDPEKLPKTIISRCQRINFKKASNKEIVDKLIKICKEEGLDFEEKTLSHIAKLADGSFRDANKILERVSLSGKITEEEVEKTAGILAEFNPEDFLKLLTKREIKGALSWIGQAVEKGANLRIITEELLENLRILLLENFGIKEIDQEVKTDLTLFEVQTLISLFSRAYYELRYAVIPQLPLEMAIVEWSQGSEKKEENGDKKESSSTPPIRRASATQGQNLAPSLVSIEAVLAKWPEILEKVKPLNHSVQAFLRATRPLAVEGDFLIIEVFYKFHKDQLEKETSRKIFEKVASEVLGGEVKMKCRLSEARQPAKPLPVVENIPVEVANENSDDIIKFAEEIFNKSTIQ